MHTTIADKEIEILQGDLTTRALDVIVNAANSSLRGGGGVDGAIHRAAGPELLEECIARHPQGCPTGDVRVTGGHELLANQIVHAVGPVWSGGEAAENELLASCWRKALHAAEELGARSIGFPAVSCGIYGFPIERAAGIAHQVLQDELPLLHSLERVEIVLFGDEDFERWTGSFGQ
jgi:O-acetyl-ADP-ribose deacetylase (regulator of RNase III)